MNVLKAVGSVKTSVKNVTNAVTSVPNNLINTVDSVMDGITKALQVQLLYILTSVWVLRPRTLVEIDGKRRKTLLLCVT